MSGDVLVTPDTGLASWDVQVVCDNTSWVSYTIVGNTFTWHVQPNTDTSSRNVSFYIGNNAQYANGGTKTFVLEQAGLITDPNIGDTLTIPCCDLVNDLIVTWAYDTTPKLKIGDNPVIHHNPIYSYNGLSTGWSITTPCPVIGDIGNCDQNNPNYNTVTALNATSLSFEAAGRNNFPILVSTFPQTYSDWKIVYTETWLRFSNKEVVVNGYQIFLTVDANTTYYPRSAMVQIGEQTLTISQVGQIKPPTPNVTVSPQIGNIPAYGGTISLSITPTVVGHSWYIDVIDKDWFSVSPKNGLGNTTETVTITVLPSDGNPRRGEILINTPFVDEYGRNVYNQVDFKVYQEEGAASPTTMPHNDGDILTIPCCQAGYNMTFVWRQGPWQMLPGGQLINTNGYLQINDPVYQVTDALLAGSYPTVGPFDGPWLTNNSPGAINFHQTTQTVPSTSSTVGERVQVWQMVSGVLTLVTTTLAVPPVAPEGGSDPMGSCWGWFLQNECPVGSDKGLDCGGIPTTDFNFMPVTFINDRTGPPTYAESGGVLYTLVGTKTLVKSLTAYVLNGNSQLVPRPATQIDLGSSAPTFFSHVLVKPKFVTKQNVLYIEWTIINKTYIPYIEWYNMPAPITVHIPYNTDTLIDLSSQVLDTGNPDSSSDTYFSVYNGGTFLQHGHFISWNGLGGVYRPDNGYTGLDNFWYYWKVNADKVGAVNIIIDPPTVTDLQAATYTATIPYPDLSVSIDLLTLVSASVQGQRVSNRTGSFSIADINNISSATATLVGSVLTYTLTGPRNSYTTALSDVVRYTFVDTSNALTPASNNITILVAPYIPPPPTPTINSFTATPQNVCTGATTTLSWSTVDATQCSIDGLAAIATQGSISTVGPISVPTTYTLHAYNQYGSTTATVVVTPNISNPVATDLTVTTNFWDGISSPRPIAHIFPIYTGSVTGASIVTPPTKGYLVGTLNIDSPIAYYVNSYATGTDTFTYKVSGPCGDSAPANITVTITPGTVPIISAGNITCNYGTIGSVGGTVSAAIASSVYISSFPTHGAVTFDNTGLPSNTFIVNYTPYFGFIGNDTFSIVAAGIAGESNIVIIPVTVIAPPCSVPISTSTSTPYNTPVPIVFTYTGYASGVEIVSGPAAFQGVLTGPVVGNLYLWNFTPAASGYSGVVGISFRTYNADHSMLCSSVGTVSVTVGAAPVISRPTHVLFDSAAGQGSAVTYQTESWTMTGNYGSYVGDYTVKVECLNDSYTGGNIDALTAAHVIGIRRTRGIVVSNSSGNTLTDVQDGDIIEVRVITATQIANINRTLNFKVSVSGRTDTYIGMDPLYLGYSDFSNFNIITNSGDIVPDAFDFFDQSNLEISTALNTNTVTITGVDVNLYVPIRVTPSANIIVNDVQFGDSTTVQKFDVVKIRALTSGSYNTDIVYTVLMGTTTPGGNASAVVDTFTYSTRPPHGTCIKDMDFGIKTGLELNTNTLTNSVTWISPDLPSLGFSVNNGASIWINGSNLGVSSATVNSGATIAFEGLTSPVYNTPVKYTVSVSPNNLTCGVNPVTGNSRTGEFVFVTRPKRTTVTLGVFTDIINQQLSTTVTSNTITIDGNIDGTTAITLTGGGQLSINGNLSGTSNVVNNNDEVAIVATTNIDYYTTNTYSVHCGAITSNWNVRTKSNDDLLLLSVD